MIAILANQKTQNRLFSVAGKAKAALCILLSTRRVRTAGMRSVARSLPQTDAFFKKLLCRLYSSGRFNRAELA